MSSYNPYLFNHFVKPETARDNYRMAYQAVRLMHHFTVDQERFDKWKAQLNAEMVYQIVLTYGAAGDAALFSYARRNDPVHAGGLPF